MTPSDDLARAEASRSLATALAGVGGFIDASGFLVLFGLFTAHMSGNTTGLGVAIGTGDWSAALERFFVIPVFVLATAGGVAWIESATRRARSLAARDRAIVAVLGAEIAALVVFVVSGELLRHDAGFGVDSAGFFLVGTAAATAMGLQNAALRRVNVDSVHTTFVTGMLTEAAVALVTWWHVARDPEVAGEPDRLGHARTKALLDVSVWITYLVGGCLGAFLVARLGLGVVVLPVTVLVAVIVRIRRAS